MCRGNEKPPRVTRKINQSIVQYIPKNRRADKYKERKIKKQQVSPSSSSSSSFHLKFLVAYFLKILAVEKGHFGTRNFFFVLKCQLHQVHPL
jgi:hypothetical protein